MNQHMQMDLRSKGSKERKRAEARAKRGHCDDSVCRIAGYHRHIDSCTKEMKDCESRIDQYRTTVRSQKAWLGPGKQKLKPVGRKLKGAERTQLLYWELVSVNLEIGAMLYLSKLRPSCERPIEERVKHMIFKKWLLMVRGIFSGCVSCCWSMEGRTEMLKGRRRGSRGVYHL